MSVIQCNPRIPELFVYAKEANKFIFKCD